MNGDGAALPRETDVLVVGGGAAGLGTALDLALRGVRTVLVEQGEFSGGTSGRHHGMLHCGARYAVVDPHAARECLAENTILRRIAGPAVEDIGGTFVLLPGDDPSYPDEWLPACRAAGIPVRELSRAEISAQEPQLEPAIKAAFRVPDGGLHAMRLSGCLVQAGRARGAGLLSWHRLDSFLMRSGRVEGCRVTDLRSGQAAEIRARVVVNAAGAWGGEVARKAGLSITIALNRGTMIALEGRMVGSVVQRMRRPSDIDGVLPRGRNTVAGTTGLSTQDPGDRRIEDWEAAKIRQQISLMVPGAASARMVHSWSAVRPLYDPEASTQGKTSRTISRRFSVIDHARTDGLEGLVTVVGGKLTTYRLMAEKASDEACRKLGVTAACRTAVTPIG
jgi:glycerol-3-phosphate dehydrogenase